MNWTLEVVCVPVSDVDRAIAFYTERLGFHLDHDIGGEEGRIVQLTPPGSGCSIVIGRGIIDMDPGSLERLQLVVPDVQKAHAHLAERGVPVSAIEVHGIDGKSHPYRDGDDLNNTGFCYFKDPDGNGWAVQQISSRC